MFSQPGIAELMRNAESGLERGARAQGMPSLLDSDSLSLDYDRELVLSAAKQCQAGANILQFFAINFFQNSYLIEKD